jgi:hypothetical protein
VDCNRKFCFGTASAGSVFLYSPVYFLASQDLCFAVLPFPAGNFGLPSSLPVAHESAVGSSLRLGAEFGPSALRLIPHSHSSEPGTTNSASRFAT